MTKNSKTGKVKREEWGKRKKEENVRKKGRKGRNRSKKEGKYLNFVSLFNKGPYDRQKKYAKKTGKNFKKIQTGGMGGGDFARVP